MSADERRCLEWEPPAQFVRRELAVPGWVTGEVSSGARTRTAVLDVRGRWSELSLTFRGDSRWQGANTLRVRAVRGPTSPVVLSCLMDALDWYATSDNKSEAVVSVSDEPCDGWIVEITAASAATEALSKLSSGTLVAETRGRP